jgi:integrase
MATIRIIKGRIYYHFQFKGVKCTEKAGLDATPENLKKTRKFIKLIDAEIANGVFQYEKYFPHGAKIEVFAPKWEDLPFNRYFTDWLAGKVLKETTRRNWESAFWKHLYPFFKDRLLSAITRADVRLFQRTLADKGLEPSTINDKAMKVLRMMLHQAYVDEIIPKNPTLGVKRLAQGLTDVDPFTIEEREEIIRGFQRYAPQYVNYVNCGFWTGWRPNEACALKWPRVDFNRGKILIREGRVLGQTGIPKAAGSLRDIDMLPPVREALTAQKALSWLLGGYVFLDAKQQPVNQELFRQKFWEPILKRLKVSYRPPYQMRHTFATLAISAGENINWVARMLGHKSPVMTLEKYNRYVPNLTRADGKALLHMGAKVKRSGVPERYLFEYQ